MSKPGQESSDQVVVYYLRDFVRPLTEAWEKAFKGHKNAIKISTGDIFKGAPAADAIVSPANSFGFMDGGIDMAYTQHFGWQLQNRLQANLKEHHDGELPVGQAVIIPIFEPGSDTASTMPWYGNPNVNEGKTIKYLISAPTMRVPMTVDNTINAYLAFRAIIREVKHHNATKEDKISSVLCPGLGTCVGMMPYKRCAQQMLVAWESCGTGTVKFPQSLYEGLRQYDHLTTA